MNKILLSSFVIVSFSGYAIYQNASAQSIALSNRPQDQKTVIDRALSQIKSLQSEDDGKVVVKPVAVNTTSNTNSVTTSKPAPTPTPTPSQTHTPVPVPTPAPAPVDKPKGQYNDGTYTGDSVDVYYGIVQVQAVISGGKLTDVIFLSYPNDNRTSLSKAQYAMPILKQESISAQSSNVNGVSGASATSEGFMMSLSSALVRAKA